MCLPITSISYTPKIINDEQVKYYKRFQDQYTITFILKPQNFAQESKKLFIKFHVNAKNLPFVEAFNVLMYEITNIKTT